MHRTIGLTGYVGPLTITPVFLSISQKSPTIIHYLTVQHIGKNNNNNLICIAPVCAKKTSVALADRTNYCDEMANVKVVCSS